jgi:hypothetical protein
MKQILDENSSHQFEVMIDFKRAAAERQDIDLKSYDVLMKNIFESLGDRVKYVSYFEAHNNRDEFIYSDKIFLQSRKIVCDSLLRFSNFETLNEKFVVINTKVVNSSLNYNSAFDNKDYARMKGFSCIDKWESVKSSLTKELNDRNIKVVVIGERKISDCVEYEFHKNVIGSIEIFDYLKSNILNLRDESYASSADSYRVDLFKKTCGFLQNSVANIHVGNGGGIHLYSQFRNCIQLGEPDRMLESVARENVMTRPFHTLDVQRFLDKIIERVES